MLLDASDSPTPWLLIKFQSAESLNFEETLPKMALDMYVHVQLMTL